MQPPIDNGGVTVGNAVPLAPAPMYVFTHPKELSEDARTHIARAWHELYPDSRAIILEEGMTVTPLYPLDVAVRELDAILPDGEPWTLERREQGYMAWTESIYGGASAEAPTPTEAILLLTHRLTQQRDAGR